MNKFTKEYIQEADCPEIQELFDRSLERGDMYYRKDDGLVDSYHPLALTQCDVFLPTGDQLDDEIDKVLNKKWGNELHWIYHFDIGNSKDYKKYEVYVNATDDTMFYQNEDNPLIAKIKLLKKLLEDK